MYNSPNSNDKIELKLSYFLSSNQNEFSGATGNFFLIGLCMNLGVRPLILEQTN